MCDIGHINSYHPGWRSSWGRRVQGNTRIWWSDTLCVMLVTLTLTILAEGEVEEGGYQEIQGTGEVTHYINSYHLGWRRSWGRKVPGKTRNWWSDTLYDTCDWTIHPQPETKCSRVCCKHQVTYLLILTVLKTWSMQVCNRAALQLLLILKRLTSIHFPCNISFLTCRKSGYLTWVRL